jgi:polar amino acid transport system permease protein
MWQRVVPLSAALSVLLPLGGCSQNWGWYVVNPATPAGQRNLKFLIDGLYYTIALSVTAICISIIVGLLIALPGLSSKRVPRSINRVYVEMVRAVPILVLILWVYYGLATSCRHFDFGVLGRGFGVGHF